MTDVRRQAWRRNLDACRVLIGGQASRASRHHLLAAMDEASRRVDECAALRADVERLQQEITHLRGALSAQEERERQAGARCGVPYELSGCDWPDAVAERVLVLQQERDEAMQVLAPNMPESGLVDACRQVKQVAISEADNAEHAEAALSALQAERDAELKWTIENLHRLYREIGTVRTVLQRKMDPTTNERAQIATLEQWASRLASMRDVLSPPSSDQETPR